MRQKGKQLKANGYQEKHGKSATNKREVTYWLTKWQRWHTQKLEHYYKQTLFKHVTKATYGCNKNLHNQEQVSHGAESLATGELKLQNKLELMIQKFKRIRNDTMRHGGK
jgi:hypothetical protein